MGMDGPKGRFPAGLRRGLAAAALLAVVAGGVKVATDYEYPAAGFSTMQTAAADPSGPTGGPGGNNGGMNGSQFSPPQMPAQMPDYQGGINQPPLDQNSGISIYNTGAQGAPQQAGQQGAQQPQQGWDQPAHGTQIPDYSTAPGYTQGPGKPNPDYQPPQQQSPQQGHQPGSQVPGTQQPSSPPSSQAPRPPQSNKEDDLDGRAEEVKKYSCVFGGQNPDGSCSALNNLRNKDKYGHTLQPDPGPEWSYENDSNPEIQEPTDTQECATGTSDPRCGGQVKVCYPKDINPDAIPPDMVHERDVYVDGSNLFVQDNKGEVYRRATQGVKDLEAQRRKDVRDARKADEALFRGKDVGHVPDIAWQGMVMDVRMVFPMTGSLNRSIGGQAGKYPIGFKVAEFVRGKWVNDECVPE